MRIIPLSCLVVLAIVCWQPTASSAGGRLPNIIFILADDLGCFELGCYGQTKIRTPQIDRLAAAGMKFTRFYAGNNVCAPSRCCLLTGRHPGHATIRDNREMRPEGQMPIRDEDVTIAEVLKRRGYATGAIGKWGLGPFGSSGDPLRRVDFFYGYNCQRHAHSHYPTYLYRQDQRFELPGNNLKSGPTHSHELFEAETLQFIRRHRNRPFFLYLPYTLPHLALQIPDQEWRAYQGKMGEDPPYDGKKGYQPHPAPRAAYAAMVTRLDQTVGKMVALLEELNLARDTLVIFTSDNGPTHNVGGADSTFFQSAGALRGLKGSMYEGGLRVPFVASWPGRIAPGTICDQPLALWDVLPTLTALTGAELPLGCDGVSFSPTLLGTGEQEKRAFLYWESPGYGGQQAVLAGEWKAVRQKLNAGVVKTELFHLARDEGENENVAGMFPEKVRAMEEIMKREHVPSKEFPIKVLDGGK